MKKPARFRARVLALANLLTVLAVLGVWLAAAFAFVPRTSSEKHCPTALVQVVRKPSGAGWESRTPQPSDPEFQPCLCNEKKLAQAQAESDAGVSFLLNLPVATLESPVLEGFVPLPHSSPTLSGPNLDYGSVVRTQNLPPPRVS
ncbi:MAG TPA: hypothetical protein PLB31_02010 [Fimbriimonadaceae bacterium]|nr:hypothetical protein [Armatimonadota bacterium]HCM72503.1 hypothetical protein [Armatimonadota bacterium]HRD31369.1 hypothetical protein [Fimbriimonadaceae bacterium]HRE93846.1 hypothetical protein [Fimbriimonadaceae bacterium]HRI73225.1 hypothetical protein [Fimbriimonadaceae bacterium]